MTPPKKNPLGQPIGVPRPDVRVPARGNEGASVCEANVLPQLAQRWVIPFPGGFPSPIGPLGARGGTVSPAFAGPIEDLAADDTGTAARGRRLAHTLTRGNRGGRMPAAPSPTATGGGAIPSPRMSGKRLSTKQAPGHKGRGGGLRRGVGTERGRGRRKVCGLALKVVAEQPVHIRLGHRRQSVQNLLQQSPGRLDGEKGVGGPGLMIGMGIMHRITIQQVERILRSQRRIPFFLHMVPARKRNSLSIPVSLMCCNS
jgi:hypothetical protein